MTGPQRHIRSYLDENQDMTGHRGQSGPNHEPYQNPTGADREAAVEPAGSVPTLLVTQAEQFLGPTPSTGTSEGLAEPRRLADLGIPMSPSAPSLSSSDIGDMTSDLMSLRSDSLSLNSETNVFRMSEDDDSASVTASSVMSLFQRVQLDPLEKDWWRSSALGNLAVQRQLLSQESNLVLKKDFITTALHWAAKHGRLDAVDMMLHAGANVNARSGYTALHLASIHSHQHVVHALINTHNAKTNLRDYHGKTAVHYWSGSSDVFNKPDAPTAGRFCRGRQTQRYALPSFRLSRSRSHGHLSLEFRTLSPSSVPDVHDVTV